MRWVLRRTSATVLASAWILLVVASCGSPDGAGAAPALVTVYYPAGCSIAGSIPPPAIPETDLDPETLKRARAQPHAETGESSPVPATSWRDLFEQVRTAARESGCDAILLEKWHETDLGDSKHFPTFAGKKIEYRVFRATAP